MTVSILVVDDESDVAELFRQRFRREVRRDPRDATLLHGSGVRAH
jgi:hypothetical protein